MNQLNVLLFFAFGIGQVLAMSGIFFLVYRNQRRENTKWQDRYIDKSSEVIKLEKQTILHDEGVFPRWRKDQDGVMVALNYAYEAVYLRPKGKTRRDYIKKKDVDVWGEEIGVQFWNNCKYVLETGNTLVKREKISDGVYHVIIKSLTIGSDGKKYVDGWSFPDEIFTSIIQNP